MFATANLIKGRPVKRDGYSFAIQGARRKARRLDAESRQRSYDALTRDEKLARCEERGGSAREIARLSR